MAFCFALILHMPPRARLNASTHIRIANQMAIDTARLAFRELTCTLGLRGVPAILLSPVGFESVK